MKKYNTSPISGMQELLPPMQAIFNDYKSKIAEVYHRHGFLNIETPTIDRNEILFAKAGGDTEKQIYRVIKTDESSDDSTQSLRFDHTVPLARYVVEHEGDLTFPFRVSQIGRNFRGERAQKGRYREFYQCDVDVIGRNNLPIFYDVQVIYTFFSAVSAFVTVPVRIRLNNRKFVSGVIEALGVQDLADDIYSIIDHAEKVPEAKTIEFLRELNIPEETVVKITTFINTHGDIAEIEEMLKAINLENDDNQSLKDGLEELRAVSSELSKMGLSTDKVEIDLKIVRGLDYYTGTVFEGILPDYPEVGSIGGGGRYDNLASNFTDQKFPGVGASIGLTRLFYILRENGLIEKMRNDNGRGTSGTTPVDYALIPFSRDQFATTYQLADIIRDEFCASVDIIPIEKKLGDTLKIASRIARYGVIIGDKEVETGSYMVKDFATGKSSPLVLKGDA